MPLSLLAYLLCILMASFFCVQLQDVEGASTQVGAGNVAIVEGILQQVPSTHVILAGLLPRGDRNVEAPSVAFHQPSKCVFQCGHDLRSRVGPGIYAIATNNG